MSYKDMNISFFRMINDLGKELTYINPIATFIAENTIYFLIATVIFYLFTRKNRFMIFIAVIALIVGELLAKLLGKLYSNNQPFAELGNVNKLVDVTVDNSFPSDHTIIFFTICVSFWLFEESYLWIILACIVGFFRIWVGVHYPGDVIVGALLGTIMAYCAYKISQKIIQRKHMTSESDTNESVLKI